MSGESFMLNCNTVKFYSLCELFLIAGIYTIRYQVNEFLTLV